MHIHIIILILYILYKKEQTKTKNKLEVGTLEKTNFTVCLFLFSFSSGFRAVYACVLVCACFMRVACASIKGTNSTRRFQILNFGF